MTLNDGYMLDTSIASASWDYGSPNHNCVRERLKRLGTAVVYVSAISVAEVEYGLRIAPNIDAKRQAKVREAMASYAVLDVNHHTARDLRQDSS